MTERVFVAKSSDELW